MVEVSSFCCSRTTYTQRELFFKNSKRWGLGRQIGLKFFEAFGVFLAKLLALFWHCKSLVHWKMYIAGSFAYNIFWFLGLKHITLKCSQNKVSTVKNLEKSFHTSIFDGLVNGDSLARVPPIITKLPGLKPPPPQFVSSKLFLQPENRQS